MLHGFIQDIIDLSPVTPNIIVLRRPPREVALSFWKLNWIPGRTITDEFPGPGEPNTLPYAGWENAHTYQRCFWYCCDVEWKIQKWSEVFRQQGSIIQETTLKNITDVNKFNALVEAFNLPPIDSVPTEKVNSFEHLTNNAKVEVPPSELLSQLENQVLESIPKDVRDKLEQVWSKAFT
jgi:hypothetical protein